MTDLSNFTKRPRPGLMTLEGDGVYVTSVDWTSHGLDLTQAFLGLKNTDLWTYMSPEPPESAEAFIFIMRHMAQTSDWEVMAIISKDTQKAVGMASYMRIREAHGSVEVGFIMFGGALRKTRGATEAMYMMMRHVFEDLDYRRYEWKCDNLNEPSKAAALRFGFTYEGLFRNDLVIKGKNRDTAWFSITDAEWPVIKAAYQAWLDPSNFDDSSHQKQALKTFMP